MIGTSLLALALVPMVPLSAQARAAAPVTAARSRPAATLRINGPHGPAQRIALVRRGGVGPLVPLPPLARAIGGTVARDSDWVVLDTPAGHFRFLPGMPLVDTGDEVRALPAPALAHGDTLLVPLAFVADVLADPDRQAWHWSPDSALLVAGPAPAPLVNRPERTTVGAEERSRFPDGLRPGHHVTLDPGHGGTDPGSPGIFFPRGVQEKDVTLAIGLLVRADLQKRGVIVTMTRTTDTVISLYDRAPDFCRANCDLFVSLHVNSLEKHTGYTRVRGFETYFLSEARTADAARVAKMENSALRYDLPSKQTAPGGLNFILKDLQTNEFLRESARAAALVQSHLGEVQSGVDGGVKQAEFAVLTTARRPAILVEMGYGTNREDARLLTTRTGQRALAGAIADAIVGYLREVDRETGDSASAGS